VVQEPVAVSPVVAVAVAELRVREEVTKAA